MWCVFFNLCYSLCFSNHQCSRWVTIPTKNSSYLCSWIIFHLKLLFIPNSFNNSNIIIRQFDEIAENGNLIRFEWSTCKWISQHNYCVVGEQKNLLARLRFNIYYELNVWYTSIIQVINICISEDLKDPDITYEI